MPYPPVVAHQEGGPAHPPPRGGGEEGRWDLAGSHPFPETNCMGISGGVPWSRAGSAALATRLANLAINFSVSKASWKAEELMGVETGARSSSQVRARVGEWATATVWMGGCGYLRTVAG